MKKTLLSLLVLTGAVALADIAPEPKPEVAPAVAETPPPPPAPAPAPQHPAGIEKAMGSGVIQGGWEYVYAAYGVGVFGVLGFAASLLVRRPKPQPGSAP